MFGELDVEVQINGVVFYFTDQVDRQAAMYVDRQTDRQRDRQTDRQSVSQSVPVRTLLLPLLRHRTQSAPD